MAFLQILKELAICGLVYQIPGVSGVREYREPEWDTGPLDLGLQTLIPITHHLAPNT